VISSTAEAEDNYLSARELVWRDVQNSSASSSSGFGVGFGVSFDKGKVASGDPLSGTLTPIVNMPAREGDEGTTRATVTPGTLELSDQRQDLASLNRDAGAAHVSVEAYDIARLKARQEGAAALSELLNGLTGDLSAEIGLKDGDPAKAALHAAAGAAVAAVAGTDIGSGAAAGLVSELANGVVSQMLKDHPDLTTAQTDAIRQWTATALGAAIGGQAGAAAALDNIKHNFLNHQQIDDLIAELISCNGSANVEDCKREVSEKYTKLDFEQEKALDNCRSIQCIADVLGDISDAKDFDYLKLLSVQTAGADENLVQRLLGYQGTDVFGLRLLTVISGAAYCDQTGGAEGCFGTGIRNQFIKEAAVDLLVELGSSASFGAVSRIIRFLKESKKGGNIVSPGSSVGEVGTKTSPLALPSPDYKVPNGYSLVRNVDGSATVTGPRGGVYDSTGRYTAEGKPIYRDNSGGYVTLDGGRNPVSAPPNYESIPLHHICTNKCTVGANGQVAWTKEYQRFFDGAGLDINRAVENLVAVPGHRGPHPESYHQYVYGSLDQATRGLTPNTSSYNLAVTKTLERIKAESVIVGSQVNKWLTRQ
ncbi:AHH domain-containing protein, partial [Pannonibacter phragmitetus]|uniref:AHH domain-containing protein n=1 Tax=Pannonibacter phragmitetus TaxID=121719 RepID=UPI001AD90B9B